MVCERKDLSFMLVSPTARSRSPAWMTSFEMRRRLLFTTFVERRPTRAAVVDVRVYLDGQEATLHLDTRRHAGGQVDILFGH